MIVPMGRWCAMRFSPTEIESEDEETIVNQLKRIALIVLSSIGISGCMTTNHAIKFPENILFQPQDKKQAMTVGIYISPEDRALPFDQCEKLTGGSMCYHGVAGTLLQPSALQAFQQTFEHVVLLDALTDSQALEADVVVALSFKELRLDTTVRGFVATRKVTVTLREQIFKGGKSLSDRKWTEATSCLGYQCQVEGRNEGPSGSEVVLKTLFQPGYLAGIGGRYGKIISTAYAASLKAILMRSVEDLHSKTFAGPHPTSSSAK